MMSDDIIAYSRARHPGPHRERVGLVALFYGLFAAPIVWAGDLMIDYGLATHGCYPGNLPLHFPSAGFGGIWWAMLLCHVVALVLIASGGLVSYRNWRVTGPPRGHSHHLIERGEGRTRFFGIVGMGFSAMFLLTVAAETLALAWLPLCGY